MAEKRLKCQHRPVYSQIVFQLNILQPVLCDCDRTSSALQFLSFEKKSIDHIFFHALLLAATSPCGEQQVRSEPDPFSFSTK